MATIHLRFPEGKEKALTLSYDDGVEQDIRLLHIMKQYGLKGTFNINSGLYAKEGTIYQEDHIHRRMTEKQITEAFHGAGQEVAVHSFTHPFLEQLPQAMMMKEIIADRETLEEQFGTIVRGMAYPFGTWNEEVIAALQSCGIVYARTVESTYDFKIPVDWMKLPATCHHNSPKLMELGKKFVEDKVTRAPYLFYLWGHSYEFEAQNNWHIIEEFAKCVGYKADIWYATNIEIYEYIEAFHRLIFSINGKYIKNPTSINIWLTLNGTTLVVKAGETITL